MIIILAYARDRLISEIINASRATEKKQESKRTREKERERERRKKQEDRDKKKETNLTGK